MRITVLFAALLIASIIAGVLTAASQGLPSESPGDSRQPDIQGETISTLH